jgi:hypothetical protein
MYTAELLPPLLSLNVAGVMFKKGVAVPIDLATAQSFAENPRFHVTGLHTRTAIEEAAYHGRPKGEALMEAIRSAADAFDVDDDDAWDRSGKHSVHALTKALGYAVTAEERDRALGIKASIAKPVSGLLETADGRTEKTAAAVPTRIRQGQRNARPPDIVEPGDPSTEGAISG